MSTVTETIFLQLPGVTGGANDPNYKSQLACDSLTWSMGGITNMHQAAVDTTKDCYTKVFVGDVSIQRKMCKGSPSVLSIFKKKKVYATANITVVLSGSTKLTYKLTAVSIPQYTQSVAGTVPTESMVLHFAEMSMEYDGNGFDIAAYTTTGTT